MVDQMYDSNYLDRYLRNELTAEEEAEFETALLDSPDLQDALEATVALREAIRLEGEETSLEDEKTVDILEGRNNWQPYALAASLLLAVFSTTMFWKVSNDATELQQRIKVLRQPFTDVLTISVDIMRSGVNVPDVVVQKPTDKALLLLEIELSPPGRQRDTIHMTLRDESLADIVSWTSVVSGQSTVDVAIASQQLPDGLVWLEMADSNGEVFDRRLLEFLAEKN